MCSLIKGLSFFEFDFPEEKMIDRTKFFKMCLSKLFSPNIRDRIKNFGLKTRKIKAELAFTLCLSSFIINPMWEKEITVSSKGVYFG